MDFHFLPQGDNVFLPGGRKLRDLEIRSLPVVVNVKRKPSRYWRVLHRKGLEIGVA